MLERLHARHSCPSTFDSSACNMTKYVRGRVAAPRAPCLQLHSGGSSRHAPALLAAAPTRWRRRCRPPQSTSPRRGRRGAGTQERPRARHGGAMRSEVHWPLQGSYHAAAPLYAGHASDMAELLVDSGLLAMHEKQCCKPLPATTPNRTDCHWHGASCHDSKNSCPRLNDRHDGCKCACAPAC